MPFTAFTRGLGVTQGRIAPTGWTPPEGSFSFVLGSDTARVSQVLSPNDFARVRQLGQYATGKLVIARARLRYPSAIPAGLEWVFSIDDGEAAAFEVVVGASGADGRTRDFFDLGWNVSPYTGGGNRYLGFSLRLRDAGAGPGRYELELPGFFLDALVLDPAATSPIRILNRDPQPNEARVPLASPIALDITDAAGAGAVGPTAASTFVTVNGVPAYSAGAFQAGFSGTQTVIDTHTLRLIIQPAVPFTSKQLVTVNVQSAASDTAFALNETYQFNAADVAFEAGLSAASPAGDVVRVTFPEPVTAVSASGAADALKPSNYAIAALSSPAVTAAVTSVAKVGAAVFDLTLDRDLTGGASYRLTVSSVTDLFGNAIVSPNNTAQFVGFACQRPADRDFDVYRMFPKAMRRDDDAGTGDLRKFASVLQEVVDLLLCDVDGFTEILDPDFAPEDFVDAMLSDMGNPFPFDLALADKRRLLRVLVSMYKQKGTGAGIVNAIRFFLGIEVTVTSLWGDLVLGLGDAELDFTFILGPGEGTGGFYDFYIASPVVLTAAQREQIRDLANYMKPAHTHLISIDEPTVPTIFDHVELDFSELDDTFILH